MRCHYCNKRLSVFKLLSGQPFCSKEHRDLFHGSQADDAINRLLSSFSEEPETKHWPVPKAPEASPITEASPAPPSSTEIAVVPPAPAEAPKAVARVHERVQENDPPEASFVPQIRPAPKSPRLVTISRTVTAEPAGQVELPRSPAPAWVEIAKPAEDVEAPPDVELAMVSEVETEPEPPLAELAALDLHVAPANSPTAAPVPGTPAEPEQNAPSILPSPACGVAMLQESGLISLPVGEGKITGAPFFVPQPQEIPLEPAPVALLSTESAYSCDAPAEDELAPPPLATARVLAPQPQDTFSAPASVAIVGALRPRTVALQAPAVETDARQTLSLAHAASYTTPQLPVSPDAHVAAAPALPPAAIALRSPRFAPAAIDSRTLAALAALLPLRLPNPALVAAQADFPGFPWRLAVDVPRLPVTRVGTVSSIRRFADAAALGTSKTAGPAPTLTALAAIANELALRVPVEKLPPASLASLPLSAEALPSAKTSTRRLGMATPAANLSPSLPKTAWRVRLPEPSAPLWSSTWAFANAFAVELQLGIDSPRPPVFGLELEVRAALNLPRPLVALNAFAPALSSATFEISHRWIEAPAGNSIPVSPAAPDVALRLSPAASVPSSTTTLATAVGTRSVELSAALRLAYFPEFLNVAPAGAEPVSPTSRSFELRIPFALFQLRASANIQPLWSDASRVKAGWSAEPQPAQLSNLAAARPSPLSLMATPQGATTPLAVRRLECAERPLLLPWNASPGSTVAMRLASPTLSLRRVALPTRVRPIATFELCSLTAACPLGVAPFGPSSNGTEQIRIVAGRIEPARMPVLPALAEPKRIHPGTALLASRNLPESGQPLPGSPANLASANWEIRTRIVASLRWTAPAAYAPAMRLAPANDRLASASIPPTAHTATVPALSSRQRIARAFTSSLRSLFPLHF